MGLGAQAGLPVLLNGNGKGASSINRKSKGVARPERFELPTLWFEARMREILNALSSIAYGRKHSETAPQLGYIWATN